MIAKTGVSNSSNCIWIGYTFSLERIWKKGNLLQEERRRVTSTDMAERKRKGRREVIWWSLPWDKCRFSRFESKNVVW